MSDEVDCGGVMTDQLIPASRLLTNSPPSTATYKREGERESVAIAATDGAPSHMKPHWTV